MSFPALHAYGYRTSFESESLGTEQENTGGIKLCRVKEASSLVATIRQGDTALVHVTTDLGGDTVSGDVLRYAPEAPYVPYTLELQTTPTEVENKDGGSLRVKAIEFTVEFIRDLVRSSEYASFATEDTRRAELAKRAAVAKDTKAIGQVIALSRTVAEESDDDSGDWDGEGGGQTVPSPSIDAQARFAEHGFTLVIHQILHLFHRTDAESSTTKFNNEDGVTDQVWHYVKTHVRFGKGFGGHKVDTPIIAKEPDLLVEFRSIGNPPLEFKHAFYPRP
jgi:hypothetical protein